MVAVWDKVCFSNFGRWAKAVFCTKQKRCEKACWVFFDNGKQFLVPLDRVQSDGKECFHIDVGLIDKKGLYAVFVGVKVFLNVSVAFVLARFVLDVDMKVEVLVDFESG